MPSVGSVSNASAVYDNVATANAPITNDTTDYLVQYGTNTRFRTAAPAVAPCAQGIDSLTFSPRTLRAGCGDILTIKAYKKDAAGLNQFVPWFGDSSAVCNIRFRDANFSNNSSNTPFFVNKIDKKDIISWKPNEIKIRVPSKYLEDVIGESNTGCAGSGLFEVKNNLGAISLSKTKLHIEYAAINYLSDDTLKKRIYMLNRSCLNQYPLRCHTDVSFSYRQCVWAAARAWNLKLGYDVFQIDTVPVTYLVHNTESIITKQIPWTPAAPGYYTKIETKHKNSFETRAVQNQSRQILNDGFEIRIHPNEFVGDKFQFDLPTLAGGNYTYTADVQKSGFYSGILHELGHGIGIDHAIDESHNDSSPNLDKELMYWLDQPPVSSTNLIAIAAANRRTLTSGNGESLKGALRVFNDSKNIDWVDANEFDKFAQPISTLALPQIGLPSTRKVCGYDNSGKVEVKLVKVPNTNRRAGYLWEYQNGAGWNPAFNSTTFTTQDSVLIVKNNKPTMAGYKNVNNMVFRCSTTLAGCLKVSDTVIFKASGSVVLKTPPSRCQNEAANWIIPTLNPTNGIFTAYNTSNNFLRTDVDTVISGVKCFKKWKFTTPSTYKIIYTVPLASYCPANTVVTDSTWFSTFADCTTLGANNQKLYINEVYKDLTAFRNGGTLNDPCKTMMLNFSAFGTFAVGDKIQVKLSDAAGNIDMTTPNLGQRIVGTYPFTAATSNKTDSIQLTFSSAVIGTASPYYRVQLYLERAGVPVTQWSDKNIEKLDFKTPTTCYAPPPPPCCIGNTGRTAPNQFLPEEIQLYPNPTTDRFTLQTPEYDAATEVSISDTQGRLISKQNVYTTTNEIETHELPNGVYYVRIAQGERSAVLKLVVMK